MATTVLTVPQQPDIEYAPNLDKWRARTETRLRQESLESELPPGFPRKLESSLVWEGETLKEHYDWVYELKEDEVQEIEEALAHFQCKSRHRAD